MRLAAEYERRLHLRRDGFADALVVARHFSRRRVPAGGALEALLFPISAFTWPGMIWSRYSFGAFWAPGREEGSQELSEFAKNPPEFVVSAGFPRPLPASTKRLCLLALRTFNSGRR
jgi:hypothetical protein